MSLLSKIKGLVTSSKHRPESSLDNGRKDRPKSYKERSSRKDVYVRQTSLPQDVYVRQTSLPQDVYVRQTSLPQDVYIRKTSLPQDVYVREHRGDNHTRPVSGNLFLQQKTLGCFSEPDVPRGVGAGWLSPTGVDGSLAVREFPLVQPFYAQRPKRYSLPNGYSLTPGQPGGYNFTNGTHGQTPMIPIRRRSDAMCGYVPKAVSLHDTSSILQGHDTSKQTMLLLRRGDKPLNPKPLNPKPLNPKPASQSRDVSKISGNPKNSDFNRRSTKSTSNSIFRPRHSLKEKPTRHVTKNERRFSHDAGIRQTSPFTSDDGNFYFSTAFLGDLIPNTKQQTPAPTSQNPTSAHDVESNRENPDLSTNNNRHHIDENDGENDSVNQNNNNKLVDNASACDEISDDADAEVSSILQHLDEINGNYRKEKVDTGKYEDIFGNNTEPLY